MQGSRHQFLAGPRFTVKIDGGRGRRHRPDQAVQLAHPLARSDQLTQMILMRHRHLAFLEMLADLQSRIAEAAVGIYRDISLSDAYVVDECAIGGTEVAQHQTHWRHANFGVPARDRPVGQDYVVVRRSTDAQDWQAQTDFQAGIRPSDHSQFDGFELNPQLGLGCRDNYFSAIAEKRG